jgi:hypothetical protein
MVFKELEKTKLPTVYLSWDWLGKRTNEGTFSGEVEIDLPSYWIEADIQITAIEQEDPGDYWTPPTSDIIKDKIEVFGIKVFDINTDEYVNLTSEETIEIIDYLQTTLEYE